MLSAAETENKALVRRWFEEVWNGKRVDLIGHLRAPDAVAAGLGDNPEEVRGEAPFRNFYANLHDMFPDLRVTIDDILAEDDKVVTRLTLHGTHMGEAM